MIAKACGSGGCKGSGEFYLAELSIVIKQVDGIYTEALSQRVTPSVDGLWLTFFLFLESYPTKQLALGGAFHFPDHTQDPGLCCCPGS